MVDGAGSFQGVQNWPCMTTSNDRYFYCLSSFLFLTSLISAEYRIIFVNWLKSSQDTDETILDPEKELEYQ